MINLTKLKVRTGPTISTPIVEEEGLYLYDPGIWDGAKMLVTPTAITRKFVRCFQKVWSQIPEVDRLTLRDYWKPRATRSTSPRISFNLGVVGPRQIAACQLGHHLDFDVFWVDRLKPRELSNVIAHELGHAISHPHGWYSQHECVASREQECVPCECRAFSYMAAWGFDPFFNVAARRDRTLTDRLSKR